MDYSSSITSEAFLKLKCYSCENYLSHFPVHISGDKHNFCGRCSHKLLEGTSAQNEVYEALAQFVQFPCCFKTQGCPEVLLPKDIPTHEQICDHQKIECPIHEFAECSWKGSRLSGLHHCQSQHADLFLKNGAFQIDLSLSHQCVNLLEYQSRLFIVRQKFYSINKLMELSISNVALEVNVEEMSCELNFNTTNRSVAIQCHTAPFDQKRPVEVFLDSLTERDNPSIVMGKINLEKSVEQASTVDEKVDEMILSELKCAKCNEYALPPIYHEKTDFMGRNSVRCGDCRNVKPVVPLLEGSRNYTLDRIASYFNYPCRNSKNGCPFIAKPPTMKSHLEFCLYGNHICPLTISDHISCLWQGPGKDINAHILLIHSSTILNSDPISENLSNCYHHDKHSNFYKCYIIKFLDKLFRVNFMVIDQSYRWVVQIIGAFQAGFMFELEIVDGNKRGSSLIAKQPCTALNKKAETIAGISCRFDRNQIANLLSNQTITFKVNVYTT